MPRSILQLNFEKTWRGGERQTLYNILGFRDAGLKVHLLCRKHTPLHKAALREGIPVHAFRNIFGAIGFLMFRARGFEVFHAQTSHILTYCVFTRPFHRATVVFTRRVDFVPRGRLTRLKYRLTHHLVGISRAVQQIVADFAGREVALISDAAVARELNPARAKQWLAEAGASAGVKILGTTAAFVPHKDPLTMVEAIRELRALCSDFVFLHFGDGPLLPAVREKIVAYGLQNHYRLMGFQEAVEDVFSVLDVFVMSSEEEGLGSSVLDAFLYGVPVVATDAGGLRDLLEEGRGLMCPKHDGKALAEALHTLLQHPEMGRQMAAVALGFVQRYHSIPAITGQYLELLYQKPARSS